jgi:serine phosphatase RsbU (regulator of sigma subunit)
MESPALAERARPGLLMRVLDAASDLGVGLKVNLVLLLVGLAPALAALLLLQNAGPQTLQNILAIYIALALILLYPLAKGLEELLVLRQTRRINEYVDAVKYGRQAPFLELPAEKGDENDFLRLKRNIFWMVQGLKNREEKVQETLAKLAEAQRQVLESIEYASLIQRSFLPSKQMLREELGEHFLIWEPRDGVGGDAYWVKRAHGCVFLAVFDCTGHGVPGAFMTLIVNSLFEQELDQGCVDNPARLLQKMNKGIKSALSQHDRSALSNDGLEGGVCCINPRSGMLHFSGARGVLLLVPHEANGTEDKENDEDFEILELKGDRLGVGFVHVPLEQEYGNHEIALDSVRSVYLATDGLGDQIGGDKRLPFGRSRLRCCLKAHAALPFPRQEQILRHEFAAYKGANAQRDDVTVLGFSAKRFA